MATKKTYTITYKSRAGEPQTAIGTFEELVKRYSYTLECGNSWNKKINRYPKTIKAFIKSVNDSIDETNGGFYRPYISLVEPQKS